MKINYLEVSGYKRFSLNNIRTFTITPKERYQMILGTNGSGKSSLIKELTPLPADSSDYLKSGYKTISVTYKNTTYLLNSCGNKHSFINKDTQEELNPGHTVTIQKELVKQYFGITPEIHNLIIGVEKFHSMTPMRRRDWFSKLSPFNYDYSFKFYNKLKENHRDIQGAIKRTKQRLVAETAKLISPEEEAKLRNDVEFTLNELNILFEESAPLERPLNDIRNDLDHNLITLTNLSNKLIRMRLNSSYGTYAYGLNLFKSDIRDEWGEVIKSSFSSIEEIDFAINKIKETILVKETLISHHSEEHSKLAETASILIKTGNDGVAVIQEKINKVNLDKKDLVLSKRLNLETSDPVTALRELESIHENITNIFSTIKENSDRRYSQTKMDETGKELYVLQDRKTKLVNQLQRLIINKEHLETHKKSSNIFCPKCHHNWSLNYDEDTYQKYLSEISNKEKEINEVNKNISDIELRIEDLNQYSLLFKEYVRIMRYTNSLKPMWDYLVEKELVTNFPLHALNTVNIFLHDLEIDSLIVIKDNELKELFTLLKSAETVGDANLLDCQNKIAHLETTIAAATSEVMRLKNLLNSHVNYKNQITEAIAINNGIQEMLKDSKALNDSLVENTRRAVINHCVKQLQSSLAIKQEALNSVNIQSKLIEELQTEIETLSVQEESYRILIKELSPVEGLIAEGLTGFVNTFVNQMNLIIKKIWSYPLKVISCAIEEANNFQLDYKFPLMVNRDDNVVSDVKEGSTGMREIVDLAFVVVAMKYLGLSDYILVLDEFASSFDKEHRVAAMNAIKTIMEQNTFSQLFMVSHYSEAYTAFTNAEVCVMCDKNVAIPGVVNKHVNIT